MIFVIPSKQNLAPRREDLKGREGWSGTLGCRFLEGFGGTPGMRVHLQAFRTRDIRPASNLRLNCRSLGAALENLNTFVRVLVSLKFWVLLVRWWLPCSGEVLTFVNGIYVLIQGAEWLIDEFKVHSVSKRFVRFLGNIGSKCQYRLQQGNTLESAHALLQLLQSRQAIATQPHSVTSWIGSI